MQRGPHWHTLIQQGPMLTAMGHGCSRLRCACAYSRIEDQTIRCAHSHHYAPDLPAVRLPDPEEYLPPWSCNPLSALLKAFYKSRVVFRHRGGLQRSQRTLALRLLRTAWQQTLFIWTMTCMNVSSSEGYTYAGNPLPSQARITLRAHALGYK